MQGHLRVPDEDLPVNPPLGRQWLKAMNRDGWVLEPSHEGELSTVGSGVDQPVNAERGDDLPMFNGRSYPKRKSLPTTRVSGCKPGLGETQAKKFGHGVMGEPGKSNEQESEVAR